MSARLAILVWGLVCGLACGLAACGGVMPARPGAPTSRVSVKGETLRRDGVELFARAWLPPEGSARAALIVVHGLRDHGDRYAAFAERLVDAGYAVYAADLRGHGRSSGPRVYVDEFDDYVADLDAYVTHVRTAQPGVPVFLFGHSMGGTIVMRYVQEKQPDLAGAVLSAPALGLDNDPLLLSMLALQGELSSPLPLLLLDDDDFSRDREVVRAMGRDPLISHAGPARTGSELVEAIHAVWTDAARLTLPLLVLHGTADRVTSPSATRDLVARLPSGDRTLRLYRGFWHDLLHEPGGEQVATDVQAWLDDHVAGTPQGSAVPQVPVRPPWGRTTSLRLGYGLAQGALDDDGERDPDHNIVADARFTLGRPFGWYGGIGYSTLDDLRLIPLGVAVRLGDGGQLAVGGGYLTSFDDAGRIPVEASLELPIGPLHVLATGDAQWALDDTVGGDLPGGIDVVHARLGIRFPGSARYWQRVVFGSGLYLAATYRRMREEDLFGFEVGFHGWGAR